MTRKSDIAEKASAQAAEIGENLKSRLESEVDAKVDAVQSRAAEAVDNAANAADAAGAEFDPNSFQAQAATQIADRIEDVARQIRETDLQAIARDTSDFARKHPLMFIGGAVAVGFLATRFMKAETPPVATDPWGFEDA